MMTTEEKLSKAIEFIKSIEKLDASSYDKFDLDDIAKDSYAYCDECDALVTAKINWPSGVPLNTEYVDYRVLKDLSNKAWHLLADLTD